MTHHELDLVVADLFIQRGQRLELEGFPELLACWATRVMREYDMNRVCFVDRSCGGASEATVSNGVDQRVDQGGGVAAIYQSLRK